MLKRPELTGRFSALQGINVDSIIEILKQAEVVMPEGEPQASRDIKDNKFIAAAESSNADYLVSEDRDLLDLVKYKNTRIVTAHKFLEILKTSRKAA